MKRKTIEVQQIKDYVNERLAKSVDNEYVSPAWRFGLCTMLEMILHETGNYKGYNNLYKHQVPEGQKPGIIFDDSPAANHQYPDDSRRIYY
jgi:hypothetical protein